MVSIDFLVFGMGVVLAASCFLVPRLFRSSLRVNRILLVMALYIDVFVTFMVLFGWSEAVAVIVLAIVFSAVGEALSLHYQMIKAHNEARDRRCY